MEGFELSGAGTWRWGRPCAYTACLVDGFNYTEYLELEIASWRELKALSGPAAALRVGWSGVWLVIAQAAESIVFFYL